MSNDEILPFPDAPWLYVAEQEKGQKEIIGKEHNTRIIAYHSTTGRFKTDEIAWCSSFVNWCLKQVQITGTNHGLARSWVKWGQAVPAGTKGAIVVLHFNGETSITSSGDHVGFLIEETDEDITLLGGNQGELGVVNEETYAKTDLKVLGYRWPAWKLIHKDVSTPTSDKLPCAIYIHPLVMLEDTEGL